MKLWIVVLAAVVSVAVPAFGQEPLKGMAPEDWLLDETPTLWYNPTEVNWEGQLYPPGVLQLFVGRRNREPDGKIGMTSLNIWSDPPLFRRDVCTDIPPSAPYRCGDAFGGFAYEFGGYGVFLGTFGTSFEDTTFTKWSGEGVMLQDLSAEDILGAFLTTGSIDGGGPLPPMDLVVYVNELFPGDANQDLSFDQLDIVRVLQAGKYLSGLAATWGEGDWNGGPGGYPGEPPAGDGLFDQKDIVAALQIGAYLSGPYAAIQPGGVEGDEQTSIIYDARTGEIAVDAPGNMELTSISIESAAGIFTQDPAVNLGGLFDIDSDTVIFKVIFHSPVGSPMDSPFSSLSFGNVAVPGLAEADVLADFTVDGSLADGSGLGTVDLIYVPEPSRGTLLIMGVGFLAAARRRRG